MLTSKIQTRITEVEGKHADHSTIKYNNWPFVQCIFRGIRSSNFPANMEPLSKLQNIFFNYSEKKNRWVRLFPRMDGWCHSNIFWLGLFHVLIAQVFWRQIFECGRVSWNGSKKLESNWDDDYQMTAVLTTHPLCSRGYFSEVRVWVKGVLCVAVTNLGTLHSFMGRCENLLLKHFYFCAASLIWTFQNMTMCVRERDWRRERKRERE